MATLADCAQAQVSGLAPVIELDPVGQAITAGGAADLGLTAFGSGNLAYQWYFNGVAIPGANLEDLPIVNASDADAGNYTVTVTNDFGSVTSAPAVISVIPLSPPLIVTEPASQNGVYGSQVSFAVSATNVGPSGYQWSLDGVPIPNATGATYTINAAAASDAGTYTVTATNSQGTATSTGAVLTLTSASPPTITVPPASQSVSYGLPFTLGVQTEGSPPISYQWYQDGTLLTGQTSATLTIALPTSASAGNYLVVATNGGGSTTSPTATVTVEDPLPPQIFYQPSSESLVSGGYTTLGVSVVGTPPFSYQWYVGGVAIPGATQVQLYVSGFTAANAGAYTVTISNAFGSVTSEPATLTLASPSSAVPQFVEQPADQAAFPGSGIALYTDVTCSQPVTYQWYLNGTTIPNATASSYSVGSVGAGDGGSYTCVCTAGANSVTSSAATVTVLETVAPFIYQEPVDQDLNYGDTLNLSVQAVGAPNPTYQWYIDGVAIPNATGQTYSAYNANATFAGTYTVTATNSSGSVTSTAAVVTVAAPTLPTITLEPASANFEPGGLDNTVEMNVEAAGAALSYQWYLNGGAIAGATQSSYLVYGPTAANAGSYTVTVSNSGGSVTSAAATLTIVSAGVPTILQQPQSMTLPAGRYEILSVNALDGGVDGIDTFQWYLNGSAIAGATSDDYSLNAVTSADDGTYTVTVANSAGSFTSTAAQIQVDSAPVITSQPQNVTLAAGGNATFSIVATSNAPDAFQWYLNGNALADGGGISGSATATLSLGNVSSANAGNYTCEVANFVGTTTSNTVALTIDGTLAPQFASSPANATIAVGASASFAVAASGNPTFQWYLNGSPIAGASGGSYSIASAALSDGGTYTIDATNNYGTASASFILSVDAPPQITLNPAGESATPGSSVTLNVLASGAPPLTYQWYLNGVAIAGATGDSLTIGDFAADNAGSYTVQVGNPGGTVTSQAAILTGGPPPVFTQQPPANIALNLGAPYLIIAAATSTPPVTYQWYFNGVAIAGANLSFYSINAGQLSNAGSYTLVATNAYGSVTSSPAMVVVNGSSGVPTLAAQPAPQTIAAGESVVFNVSLSGTVTADARADNPSSSASYQWFLNGIAIPNATGATLIVQDATAADAGTYTCLVTTATGSVLSNGADLAVQTTSNDGRLVNVSVMTEEGPGSNVVTMGFVSGRGSANGTEPLLLRVSGPALAQFGVTGFLTDPELTLFNSNSVAVNSNEGWASTLANQLAVAAMDTQVGAFPLTNTASADSALATTLASGDYTVQAASQSGGSGKVLAEVYDATTGYNPGVTPRLINVSCRQSIAAGGTMTVGFTVGGTTARTVLIRADGPSLTAFGVTGVMPDPTLTLFNSSQTQMQTNAGWGGDAAIVQAAQMVSAFALSSDSSLDSAMLLSLPAGTYTAEVGSASGVAGTALVEVYEVP